MNHLNLPVSTEDMNEQSIRVALNHVMGMPQNQLLLAAQQLASLE